RRTTQAGILFRILQKINDLDKFSFGLVDTCHIIKSYFLCRFLIEAFSTAATETHHSAHAKWASLSRCTEYPDIKENNQYGRTKTNEECDERIYFLLDWLGPDDHIVVHQEFFEAGIDKLGQFRNKLIGLLSGHFNTVVLRSESTRLNSSHVKISYAV